MCGAGAGVRSPFRTNVKERDGSGGQKRSYAILAPLPIGLILRQTASCTLHQLYSALAKWLHSSRSKSPIDARFAPVFQADFGSGQNQFGKTNPIL